MSYPVALPSPPHGAPAFAHRGRAWLRRLVTSAITAEPTDAPARLAVGASVAAALPGFLGTLLGHPDFLLQNPVLLHASMTFWPVIPALQMTALLSRSPTARFLAATGTVAIASLAFLVPQFGTPPLLAIGAWLYHTAITTALGLWLVRGLRRWLVRNDL